MRVLVLAVLLAAPTFAQSPGGSVRIDPALVRAAAAARSAEGNSVARAEARRKRGILRYDFSKVSWLRLARAGELHRPGAEVRPHALPERLDCWKRGVHARDVTDRQREHRAAERAGQRVRRQQVRDANLVLRWAGNLRSSGGRSHGARSQSAPSGERVVRRRR